jgi:hypothetical protein
MCQRTEALGKANVIRYGWRDVKSSLGSGTLPLCDALIDVRAARHPIHKLLDAQPQWGAARTRQTLTTLRIWPLMPVADLTRRQRERIVEMADIITSGFWRGELNERGGRKNPKPKAKPKMISASVDAYEERLAAVCDEAHRRGWSTRAPEDTQLEGVIVITPLGEAMLSDLEDLTFLAAELEAA